MEILGCIWLDQFVDKIIQKHKVYPEEVEDMLSQNPQIRMAERGDVKGEDLYMAFGRSYAGRYLSVLFIMKKGKQALVISARDMSKRERKSYGRRK